MTTKSTGGPAFPIERPTSSTSRGMSLRDWFAGMAMQGLLAAQRDDTENPAESAYLIADAMIAERSKP